MKNIIIRTVPYSQMRYPTCGDYEELDNRIIITVADTGNPDMNFLVARHELDEMYLCKKRGISFKSIDEFDMKYEEAGGEGEPGDEPDAPYYKEHQFATVMERLMCNELGLDWNDYDAKIEETCK